MNRKMKSGLLAVAVALALGWNHSSASAQDLAQTGKAFANDLAQKALACKDKITGINLESLKAVFGCLVAAVKEVGATALLNLAKALYDQGVKFLKDNTPKAKEMLTNLANKLVVVIPQLKQFTDPVISGITEAGGDALVTEAQKCRDKIVALNLDSLKNTFTCLKGALATAGKSAIVGVVKGLYEAFVNLLKTGCDKAVGKLQELVAKVKGLVPQAGSLLTPELMSSITNGCKGAVDKIPNPAQR